MTTQLKGGRRMRAGFTGRLTAVVTVVVVAVSWGLADPAYASEGTFVFDQSAINHSAFKTQYVDCPGTPTAIGGHVDGGVSSQAYLQTLALYNSPESVFDMFEGASATEDGDGYSRTWAVTAQAVCHSSVPGWEVVYGFGPVGTASSAAIASCPSGKAVIGAGGGSWTGTIGGQVGQGVLTYLQYASDLSWGRVVLRKDVVAPSQQMQAYVQVICATRPAGLQLVTASSVSDSATTKAVTANCPAGKYTYGAGFGLVTGFGGVVLNELDITTRKVTARGYEAQGGITANWNVQAYVICAN
jgi:hypothetical protein